MEGKEKKAFLHDYNESKHFVASRLSLGVKTVCSQ